MFVTDREPALVLGRAGRMSAHITGYGVHEAVNEFRCEDRRRDHIATLYVTTDRIDGQSDERDDLRRWVEGVLVPEFTDDDPAWSWLATEHANLLACLLPWPLATFLDRRGHWHDLLATQQAALDAACRFGDRTAQAGIHRLLSHANLESSFAQTEHVPVVRFKKDDRKIEVMGGHIAAQAATGRSGVAAIGVAQEYQNVFAANQRQASNGIPWFSFTKADRRVSCFYFYLWDEDFGPAFIKVCAYFPYPIKVWVNGHEWAKRQCVKAGIGFTALSNGFATCADPAALQAICDRLGPGTIEVFFQRWMSVLPLPLTAADRDAGYWCELSMRQIETSRTLVFDAPRHARGFFEALVADNLDLGRPDSVELIFTGRTNDVGASPTVDPVSRPRWSPATPTSRSTSSSSTPASSSI